MSDAKHIDLDKELVKAVRTYKLTQAAKLIAALLEAEGLDDVKRPTSQQLYNLAGNGYLAAYRSDEINPKTGEGYWVITESDLKAYYSKVKAGKRQTRYDPAEDAQRLLSELTK